MVAGELAELRQTTDRMRAQLTESQHREKVLVRRLAAKEQETQDYVVSNWCDVRFVTLPINRNVIQMFKCFLKHSGATDG